MKQEDIQLSDWYRLWIGEVPVLFFVEALLRALVVYLLLVVSMRSMGKRMASSLSRNELATLVSLAAAIGVPILSPDRGLLPGVIIALIVIGTERGVPALTGRKAAFENFFQGNLGLLVIDGVLQVKNMQRDRISRERVIAQLRSKGIGNLGKVKRLYMEASGSFSLVKQEPARPGLSLLPDWDTDFRRRQPPAGNSKVCAYCGTPGTPGNACGNCNSTRWVQAVW